jgi:hypothetical protein
VRTEVTFREGEPGPDMTRDEVVTWLLGSMEAMHIGQGIAVAWVLSGMVDALKDEEELPVATRDGTYVLTVTTARRWFRSPVRTYHAEEI